VGVDTAGRKFLTEAAMGGMTEVEAGELAARKAVQNDVKVFSEEMVTDHGNANEELKRIAAAKGVELPRQVDRKHRSDAEWTRFRSRIHDVYVARPRDRCRGL
jgi:putative membrane protein